MLPRELLALLHVNRQLRQETAPLVFCLNSFGVDATVLIHFLHKPGETRSKQIEVSMVDLVKRLNLWSPQCVCCALVACNTLSLPAIE
jgi:hypothetical protein